MKSEIIYLKKKKKNNGREEREKYLARDVFDIFATHSGLVHDVSDTKWMHSRPCFRDFQKSIFNIHDQKSSGKSLLCI